VDRRFTGASCLHHHRKVTIFFNFNIILPPLVDDVDKGKLHIHPPERSLVILRAVIWSKSGGNGRSKLWILSTKYFFHIRRVFTCREISGFNSSLKENVLRIFFDLKNPSPQPGLNSQTLGSMSSTLTITTLRRRNVTTLVGHFEM
jgi:hypothetical protein